jgi:hypothetical protein
VSRSALAHCFFGFDFGFGWVVLFVDVGHSGSLLVVVIAAFLSPSLVDRVRFLSGLLSGLDIGNYFAGI